MAVYTRLQAKKTISSVDCVERAEFPEGKLPTTRDYREHVVSPSSKADWAGPPIQR